jgi:hypothetical protein
VRRRKRGSRRVYRCIQFDSIWSKGVLPLVMSGSALSALRVKSSKLRLARAWFQAGWGRLSSTLIGEDVDERN